MTENEMVGWHHQLDGHEFEQAPRVGDRQGSLLCCSPWGHKESGMTEQLNRYILFSLLKSSFTLVPFCCCCCFFFFFFLVFCVQKHPVSNHMLFYFLRVLLIAVYSTVA